MGSDILRHVMLRKLRIALVGVFVAVGVGVLGLVFYSYFISNTTGQLRVRGETAVNTSAEILTTSRGEFIDKTVPSQVDQNPAPFMTYEAPDFELTDLEGDAFSLSQFKGKPVLLNFWATWCPPCRKEMPDLQAFDEKYGEQVQVLGVNWDYQSDVSEEVREFLDEYDITYPNVLDKSGEVFVKYQLTGLPVTYWIDEEGVIRGIWFGAMKEEDIVTGFQKITDVIDE